MLERASARESDRVMYRETDRGLVFEHNPGPEHGVVQLRVVERVPNTRIEWEWWAQE